MNSSLTNGAISELMCASMLLDHGWAVAFPFTHQNPWDIIIYKEGVSRTVQVKGGTFAENTFTVIKAHWENYNDVDYIVLHDRIHQNWYIFVKGELDGRRSVTLNPNRLTQQLNNWRRIK